MSRSAQKQMILTKNIRDPNPYIKALHNEYKGWAFDELSALQFKGKWREKAFKKPQAPLHLEIGPGNGKLFAHRCLQKPEDCFLSIELKYKALIQTIKRVRKNKSENGKIIRYNASLISDLFEKGELNNVFIYFPDPWLKKRRTKKHQLIQEEFCKTLFPLQKAQSFLELKTDSEDYFYQSIERFKKAGYRLAQSHQDLYKGQKKEPGFMDRLSHFEMIFFQKQIPIKQALFSKN